MIVVLVVIMIMIMIMVVILRGDGGERHDARVRAARHDGGALDALLRRAKFERPYAGKKRE